jgi:hypothetical protein
MGRSNCSECHPVNTLEHRQARIPNAGGDGVQPADAVRGDGRHVGRRSTGRPYAQTSLSVGAEDVTGVSLTLSEGVKVSGRIEFVGATPAPTTAQLRGATVVLTPADGRSLPATGFNATDRVSQDAQFRTPGYPPGKYLASMNPTPGPGAITSVTIGGRDVTDDGIDLKDSDVGDGVITYTDKISSLTGTFARPRGPTATATVVAFQRTIRPDRERHECAAIPDRGGDKGAFTMNGSPLVITCWRRRRCGHG